MAAADTLAMPWRPLAAVVGPHSVVCPAPAVIVPAAPPVDNVEKMIPGFVSVTDGMADVAVAVATVPTKAPENAAAPHTHPEAPPVGIVMLREVVAVKPVIDHTAISALLPVFEYSCVIVPPAGLSVGVLNVPAFVAPILTRIRLGLPMLVSKLCPAPLVRGQLLPLAAEFVVLAVTATPPGGPLCSTKEFASAAVFSTPLVLNPTRLSARLAGAGPVPPTAYTNGVPLAKSAVK